MQWLILGLVLFLGAHASRIFAPGWRQAQIERRGEKAWKGLYSLVSLVGLILLVWGYGQARLNPVPLWQPVLAFRHLAALLTCVSFVLVVAAYVPRNAFKARLGHPMVMGVKVWALAHLLANHTLADVVLFGSFLAWAVLCFSAARKRDRLAGVPAAESTLSGTLISVVVGVLAWAVFAVWAHQALIGVRPY